MEMNSDRKLYCAIAAILGGAAPVLVHADTPAGTSPDTIQEITVTAQRRTENMQDVPITIQAITADTMQERWPRFFGQV
jgi:iron complex outermembrane receptor protein